MTDVSEQSDEELKFRSREWWTRHSQDYFPSGEASHTGARRDLDDEAFRQYLDELDGNFRRQAYFAQGRGEPLFSALIPIGELKGARVLEVGCGLGAHTEVLARAGAQVTAIDLSPMSVEMTRRRLDVRGLEATVEVADAEDLPFDDGQFDYIWSWGVIHHSPNTVTCARELTRVLRPGGRLGIMLYNRQSWYNLVNVIFRYGVLRGQLLRMSMQELHNRYTDGKYIGGAPLSKYYTARQIREDLFPDLRVTRQIAFEQKRAVSWTVPEGVRDRAEDLIPDQLFTALFKRGGFLLFTEAWRD